MSSIKSGMSCTLPYILSYSGKGQFICGNKLCGEYEGLHSYELPFTYREDGEMKSELVKVRTCEDCSKKLFFHRVKEKKCELNAGNVSKEHVQKKRKTNDVGSADTRS